jgi:hypothetical protein
MNFSHPTKQELNAINMTHILANIKECPEKKYVDMPAGVEHYRLLHWLGWHHMQTLITEVGTYMGFGTLCLADNPSNSVTTYDLDFGPVKWIKMPENIIPLKSFNENGFDSNVRNADIIFVDTWHNGIMEKKLLDYLISKDWHGLLIYDDLHYNEAMREFWRSIQQEKYDLTEIGHVTGTGLVIL